MNRPFLTLAFAVLGLVACTASDTAPAGETALKPTQLDEHASQLRADFNQAIGAVKLLLIVDPACSVCLRGLAEVDEALLAAIDDPRLQTFVVHTSVIGGTDKDVAPAAELMHNRHVRHYWDPTGNFGREVSESLQLKRGEKSVYAWDVWMIYGSEAELPARGAPAPVLFMHQLPALRGHADKPFLDADVFAAKARALLAKAPSVPAK